MYKIYFYKDKNGKQPILNHLKELGSKKDKDSRIKVNKIGSYIKMLSTYGTAIKEPYVKHLEGEIWELRPLRDRILFAVWVNNSYILLHMFTKKTQKTPKREIDQAKNNLKELIERGVIYE